MKTLTALKRLSLRHLRFSSISETPGVYLFLQKGEPIYIGKALSLKNRLKSYFSLHLAPKTTRMLKEAQDLSFIKVTSELEALLLEANLIQKYQPKYNSAAKDDKHPLYIRITKEEYPQVLTARKIEVKSKNLAFFGPFPSSRSVRSVLRMLRRIFPYSEHKVGNRPCLYSHIGLCNPCPSAIEREKDKRIKKSLRLTYRKNIRRIKSVLSGKFKTVRSELAKEMLAKAKDERFEEAQGLKEQIDRLDYITQTVIPSEAFLENPNLLEDLREEELKKLKEVISKFISLKGRLSRIECFDISHLAGVNPTASMVTFINGEADKNFYRHFRIRQIKGADDVASMQEVARRRSKYFESWGRPNLIVVDGGKTQVSAFFEVLVGADIPVVGIAKRYETLVIPIREDSKLKFEEIRLKGPALNIVTRIRDEAHRFARRYHHRLLKRDLLSLS